MTIGPPSRAYDISLHDRPFAPDSADQGWCFGLPRGLEEGQWPLDPVFGYPLQHGFTLRLPEDYRVHGPDLPWLSFFSTAMDHLENSDWSRFDPAIVADANSSRPDDPAAQPFWDAMQNRHPHLHYMTDILDYYYAVVFSTDAAISGPTTPPPDPIVTELNAHVPQPSWMTQGAFSAFVGTSPFAILGQTIHPRAGVDATCALTWGPRREDPNAGLGPRDTYDDEPAETGYVQPYYFEGGELTAEAYRQHDWAADHKPNHIGGTMRPVQGVPTMSPFYIGFEEYLGGYNFGTGNAQLDFKNMIFDWAQ
ncbi:hypothetical protein [Thalassococcus sp. S3]|uniref:hypothetical protein n=1 Tax=Thalassococcus sp. S3 TaxID=2017482 RepID=UPI001024719F|nr:hypothetical protein [Thalassococcus sp. S3]QBF32399.1 hypothetical protein CFI11_14420 [Thalassococcus sp. S3]